MTAPQVSSAKLNQNTLIRTSAKVCVHPTKDALIMNNVPITCIAGMQILTVHQSMVEKTIQNNVSQCIRKEYRTIMDGIRQRQMKQIIRLRTFISTASIVKLG